MNVFFPFCNQEQNYCFGKQVRFVPVREELQRSFSEFEQQPRLGLLRIVLAICIEFIRTFCPEPQGRFVASLYEPLPVISFSSARDNGV